MSHNEDSQPGKENQEKRETPVLRTNELSSIIKTLQLELGGLQDEESDSDSSSSSHLSKIYGERANSAEGSNAQVRTHTGLLIDDLNNSRHINERQPSLPHDNSSNITSVGVERVLGERVQSVPLSKVESPVDFKDLSQPLSIELTQSPSVSLSVGENVIKVKIRFSPIGSITPLNKMVILSSQPFSVIINFVKRKTNMKHVYLYINNSFAPSGQQLVGELWEQFKINDELWISYCGGVAFG